MITPTIKKIPKIAQENIDSGWTALTDKLDSLWSEWEQDAIKISYILDPAKVPAILLEELNFLLSAGFKDYDSETTKRKKIYNAIKTHKNRGTWNDDTKIRIDIITGLSPGARILSLYTFYSDDWILVGDGLTPSAYYWASMGADGIDTDLGIGLIGDGTEIEVAGNIYIDCHEGVTTPVLTTDQVNQIVEELKDDVVPAYMRVFLGYIDGSNIFQIYAIIQ